jgi:c-di-AMP phosphodiesterase-like protein
MKLWQILLIAVIAFIILGYVLPVFINIIFWLGVVVVIGVIVALALKGNEIKESVTKAASDRVTKQATKGIENAAEKLMRDLEKSVGIENEEEKKEKPWRKWF